jgi:glutamate/tyrosine decarboxylase-like PLP-dependent enzyme
MRESLPQQGSDPQEVFQQLEESVFSNMFKVQHPRFFAFIPSPSNFVSILAETLISGHNVFAGTWLEGSGPAAVEWVTIDWLRQMFGYPESAGGLFLSGGSVANLTALNVAREVKLRDDFKSGVVYCSDQTHSSIERGLKVLGLRPEQLRKVQSDDDFRLSLPELQKAVTADRSRGKSPFCVAATAGTTNTGSVDPLDELSEFCQKEGLWLHVDGAYGGAAVLSERERYRLKGIERADSLTLDPHKWLFQPYETGCLLLQDRRLLWECFNILPEYLKDATPEEGEVNFYDYGIQLTRSFRALKLWLSLKVFGLENFAKAVDRGMELAVETEKILRSTGCWQVVTPAQMGMVTFRYRAPEIAALEMDRLHQQIVNEIISGGWAMLSTTILRGRTTIHMCTINPRTTTEDIRETIDRLESIAKRLAPTTS